jgi:IS5 family transposase
VIEARRPRLTQAEEDTIKGAGTPARVDPRPRARRSTGRGVGPSSAAGSAKPQGRIRSAKSRSPCRYSATKTKSASTASSAFCRYTITHAAAYDRGRLGAVLDRDDTVIHVWADTTCRSAANLALLDRRGLIISRYSSRRRRGAKRCRPHIVRGNATCARVRSRIEHVFAAQKCWLGLLIRAIGLARARVKIDLANLACNFIRLACLNRGAAPA